MRHSATVIALALALGAGAGSVQAKPVAGSAPVMAAISAMVTAVNKGEMATAFAAFTDNPSIVEDLAPFRGQGPGAPQAWIGGMGANAEAHAITTINMRLSPPTRMIVTDDRAYAVVPGRLSYKMKDGHSEHANGLLTFTMVRQAGAWKIDGCVWSGPAAKR